MLYILALSFTAALFMYEPSTDVQGGMAKIDPLLPTPQSKSQETMAVIQCIVYSSANSTTHKWYTLLNSFIMHIDPRHWQEITEPMRMTLRQDQELNKLRMDLGI